MSNLLGLSSFTLASPFSDIDVVAFERTASYGYDVIEVCVENPALLSADALNTAAEATGLQIGICGAFGPNRDLSHEDAERRDGALEYLIGCIDLAAEVGSPHVAGPMYAATGQTRMLEPEARAAQRERAADSLRRAAEHAQDVGVRLAVEPLNRFETDLVNTTEQALELLELIGSNEVGLLIDTFHMNIEEKSVTAAINAASTKIFHVQVSENDRGTPGSGQVRWDEFFAALRGIDYRGQLVVESFLPTVKEIARAVSLWRPVASSMDELAREGIAFLRNQLQGGERG